MAETTASMQRPQRWDEPLSDKMTEADVAALLAREPFCQMDPARFPPATPLAGILRNDCRIVDFQPGDLVIREGDYGNSAFLILDGLLRVSLDRLPKEMLGRSPPRKKSLWQTVAQIWSPRQFPEARDYGEDAQSRAAMRRSNDGDGVFLQDVPAILDRYNTVRLGHGEMFGELAALSRTPRTASVFAEKPSKLLEIRWQGLKLLRRDKRLKEHLDRLYRENSLRVHLRETPLFRTLPELDLAAVADATRFETYGDFEWIGEYRQLASQEPNVRIAAEPLIAAEGSYANDLLLIRSGFARVSQRHGDGHRTLSYLGKGKIFGLAEIAHNGQAASGEEIPFQNSLRAIGYVDVLRVPAGVVRERILPHLRPGDLPPLLLNLPGAKLSEDRRSDVLTDASAKAPTGLLEFLVDHRLTNGRRAMVIDLDRCTRCDDCVRACAATHDNNPRFLREGERYGKYLFTSACMHCMDPVCMIGCPTGAIARDEETGNVAINDRTCIGCATCANSCPYQNIRMVEIREPSGGPILDETTSLPILKATKCDMCREQWTGPACQNACPHDALIRIDLTDTTAFQAWSNR